MRRRSFSSLAALVALCGCLAVAPAAAQAAYGGAQLLSGTAIQEFDNAQEPALAAGGGWAAFQGSLGGVAGVYRRNLQTGAIDLVAGGDASGPSISADGRYVAFTTTADLDPADEPAADDGCPEVYVRDMDVPAGAPGADTLVAALNGTAKGITFAGGCPASREPGIIFAVAGAQAATAVALSDDGRKVAFTVVSASDLGIGSGETNTPASQVAVRDLDTDTTTVVSVTPSGQPTPGGGAYPSTTSKSLNGGLADNGLASTAAISGDGTAVAWMGTEVPAQVPSATDVVPGMEDARGLSTTGDPAGQEVEPLWRRIADGPAAVTTRLMAGAGLSFYGYYGYQDSSFPIEGGTAEESTPEVPALSDDGDTVAVLADAPPQSELAALGTSGLSSTLPYDAYVVHVGDGSAPQVTPLTTIPDYKGTGAAVASLDAIAISPSGTEVGFETARTQFALAPPTLITPPTSFDKVDDTYVANVAQGTLAHITSTFDGSPADGNSESMAFDQAGDVAVASLASNLFFGNPNPETWQVYLYGQIAVSAAVAPESISAPSSTPPPVPLWRMSATAAAQRNGTVLIRATVPGAGRLSAAAAAQLSAAASSAKTTKKKPKSAASGPRRTAHAASRNPKPTTKKKTTGKTKKPSKPPKGTPVASRTVASAHGSPKLATNLTLTLRVTAKYRALVKARTGLYTVVTVTFTAPGHSRLTQRIPVTFRVRPKPKPPATTSKARGR